MRFLLDQNLSPQTSAFLRTLGYDVLDVGQLGLAGASDLDILQRARTESRIVITFNADFADVREIPLGNHAGVIRLRIFPQTIEVLHPILKRELAELQSINLSGCLVIIDNWRVRLKRP
ncbi:MAG TPA: DUF5615 family PIN-like protein [Bacteroidota bacterium]